MRPFSQINAACLSRYPTLLVEWLPGGRVTRREYVCSSLAGGNGRSLSVNLQSGVWRDFATDDGGADPVSLYAAINQLGQGDAARNLERTLGLFREAEARQAQRIAAIYEYLDSEHRPRFQVVRFAPKEFRQRRPDGNGGWVWSVKGIELIPYRLPEVLKNTDIFIVEGEKDADRLAALVAVAQEVRILSLPDLPPRGDVSDWPDAGGAKAQLLNMVKAAPEEYLMNSGYPLSSFRNNGSSRLFLKDTETKQR